MPLSDDGDIIRGLGFVTMYSAWVEEDVDDLLRIMDSVAPFDEKKQRLGISQKLKHAKKLVLELNNNEVDGLPDALENAIKLFERRNEFVHGRIYAGQDRIDYIKGGRKNASTKQITSAELYDLANDMYNYRRHFIGPKLFRLPRAVSHTLQNLSLGAIMVTDNTFEEKQSEESAALDNERRAFERRQTAVLAVTKQFYPQGNGQPATSDIDELEAADADWKIANTEVERICNEIRTGVRR
jgi:hypothetical protein